MRTLRSVPFALLLGAASLQAQGFWESSLRLAPQYQSYRLQSPLNEKISSFSLPLFYVLPLFPALTVDVGTAFATATVETETFGQSGTTTTTTSEISGLTDTQIRANYSFGQDFVVLTAGVNLPTGSATVDADQINAATRIGSDFLMFPISGFGSGLGFTGGVALARPVGAWNVGFGTSVRYSSEFEPFRDASGATTKFTPGPEYRARLGADLPYGTGRMSFGVTYSSFGDDQSDLGTFSSGDRIIGQFAMNNSMKNDVDYSFVLWNLYRTSGTLINGSESPMGNITNALLGFGVRAPGNASLEPSIETRVWTQESAKTSFMTTLGLRLSIPRGRLLIVPGFGFSLGTMEGASLTGFRGTLGMRIGG
jgi:hypothetical protein